MLNIRALLLATAFIVMVTAISIINQPNATSHPHEDVLQSLPDAGA